MAKFDEGGSAGAYYPPFERTGRPYVFDLCDHYNRTMHPASQSQGGQWFVDNQGQVRLGQSLEWTKANSKRIASQQEYERQQWVRHNWRQDDE